MPALNGASAALQAEAAQLRQALPHHLESAQIHGFVHLQRGIVVIYHISAGTIQRAQYSRCEADIYSQALHSVAMMPLSQNDIEDRPANRLQM